MPRVAATAPKAQDLVADKVAVESTGTGRKLPDGDGVEQFGAGEPAQ